MNVVNLLDAAQKPELHRLAINGNAALGALLLQELQLGASPKQVHALARRSLGVNDAFTFLAMPAPTDTEAARQAALNYLLSRLPRPHTLRQVVNTLIEVAPCSCAGEQIAVPEAPTDGLVDDASNVFSCVPNPLYPSASDYELEIEYTATPPAPSGGIVDDEANTFSCFPVPGLLDPSEYEIEISQ